MFSIATFVHAEKKKQNTSNYVQQILLYSTVVENDYVIFDRRVNCYNLAIQMANERRWLEYWNKIVFTNVLNLLEESLRVQKVNIYIYFFCFGRITLFLS